MEFIYLFIHSPTDGHLGWFKVWVVINKSAINTDVQAFMLT